MLIRKWIVQAMEPPNSSYPDASEARIANTSLRMLGDRKFQPSFLNAPSKATQGSSFNTTGADIVIFHAFVDLCICEHGRY